MVISFTLQREYYILFKDIGVGATMILV